MSALQKALATIREQASNTTELGNAFERLSKVFLENDATQTQQYSKVWHYEDWAKEHEGYSVKDIGIDLVAKLRDEEGYCAVQCKFYESEHSISKSDLDSFISASSTNDFTRLMLIDTSTQPIGSNAQTVFNNINQEYIRIQLSELEESRIDWSSYIHDGAVRLHSKKELRDHQIKALNAVREGLAEDDRGKMIMACGTGKTFTSLRIAEELAGAGKTVLYMVPSLALMSQTVREWKNDAKEDFTAFSACSDDKVGKKKASDDQIEVNLNDLAFPATTDARKLSEQIKNADKTKMTVVFSTYHSIDVISKSQYEHELGDFDLIVCDEAHRTTGATLVGDDESNFVKIHSNDNVRGKKRLYMTATPRIYGETARRREDEGEVNLASMDDKSIFGENLFHRGFGRAVENNLLTDYKVVVLMMDEQLVSDRVQRSFTEGAELELDDATKMVGCYKALAKVGMQTNKEGVPEDIKPMKRALAFCQNIKTSQMFSSEFSSVVNDYISHEDVTEEHKTDLKVELFHVDGTFNAEQRNEKLSWLKDETDENICRVLTNARCLSEGVDVPSLDAIMFLHPRKSQIDVVQSVGRVMRKAEGKKLGYVILPITVAPGVSAEKALNDNERYQVVWQILNALRAHDERFDSTINRIGLGEDVSDRIEIIDGTSTSELEATTAVVEDVKSKAKKKENSDDDTDTNLGGEDETEEEDGNEPEQLSFTLTDLSQAIKAKIVEKCGTRDYWENWASDIAKIAQQHITRINSIVLNSGTKERAKFMQFVEEIRDDLNPEITETDAVEMLAQHIITRPVFDTLFQGNRFTSENAVSKAMETVLAQIYDNKIDTETRTLEKFYDSVKRRAADIITSTGRQTLILELYDRFFRNAFPLMTQKLGIVYTPVEVVDFIVHSVEDVMQEEFGSSLGDEGVHVLDPFSGTGTFISRLLQSGVMSKEQIRRKFKTEIHANEIVLLAYYIACINIEAVYDDLVKDNQYQSFDGMVLTDTFQLYEQDRDMIANLLPDNSERRTKQKQRDITIVIGNPPYSAGQSSANDNAANLSYPNLDARIEKTYASASTATNKNALYDSYIRAFRWATDRIGDEGIIGFVTNAGWVDGSATDGFRKFLTDEFSKIYVFHLRGNQRTSGELSRKEGGKIFGSGSRAPIAITILVKNKQSTEQGKIYFHDIGDYLDQKQKLSIVKKFKSISGIAEQNKFTEIQPDSDNDWINQGDKKFNSFFELGNKAEKDAKTIFSNYSRGIESGRDVWCYNFSKNGLFENFSNQMEFYNTETDRLKNCNDLISIKKSADKNPKKISWTSGLFDSLKKGTRAKIGDANYVVAQYRPFCLQNLITHDMFTHRFGQMKNIFPSPETKNLVICTSGVGGNKDFSCFMSSYIPDIQMIFNGQNFPLYLYDRTLSEDLLSDLQGESQGKKYAIKKTSLDRYKAYYAHDEITETDIFYYIYGLLHSPGYRERFSNNLLKDLARIPFVRTKFEFEQFRDAGLRLADLHVDFMDVTPFLVQFKEGDLRLAHIPNPKSFYRVEKMKFAKKGDKSSVIYNKNITIENIPLEAYEYVVNGKPALEWVMERQCVKTDKASGIVNDANDYANETMNNPAYPLELFQRVITVSLETMKIVKSLPKLDID
ncbi:DEAD/DEAH box helicase family protein [Alphaproteobacteria bacterium]|nr:DEAD/DEAH box helicase family protein [Alphaproteobacteria bacterium]